jgi:hypothetical protein
VQTLVKATGTATTDIRTAFLAAPRMTCGRPG